MNNDMYIEIIKHSSLSEYKTLKQINIFFKYYTEKILKQKIKIFRKHFKNIKCNLLYQRKNPLKMLYNLNFSFNTYTLKDLFNCIFNTNINQLKLPSQLIKNNFDNTSNTHIVGRYGDILQSFTICGKNIKKVELYIGGNLVWKSWYLDANLINIQPFFNGIILIKLCYHEVKIKVYAEKCSHIYTYYKLLNHGRREIACSPIQLPYVFYNNKKLYKCITYNNGMISLN